MEGENNKLRLINLFFRAINYFFRFVYGAYYKKIFHSTGKRMYVKFPIFVKGPQYIHIGDNFCCGYRTQIEAWDQHEGNKFNPYVEIGNNVTIGHNCHIGAINKIIIGDNVLTGARVLITDHSHGRNSMEELEQPANKRMLYSKGPVVIGNNVWIGEGVSILPGVIIGENAIIGSNSVVTHDVPANTLVAGNPAKIIKKIDE